MTERCTNCGTELFTGQQFCRRCGAPTAPLAGEAPTQILRDTAAPPPPSASATTTLPPQRGTGAGLWGPRHTGPQTPFPSFAHTSPLASAPAAAQPSKGRRWLIPALLGLLLIAVLGVSLGVVVFRGAQRRMAAVERGMPPPAPPAPPGLPGLAPGESVLDEAGAIVTADETVLTKTFELGDDAVFTLKNTQGDIVVEGWDEDRVELKVTKRGGSAEDRQAARVRLTQDDELLALSSADNRQVKISYEVKLPRSLERMELSSRSGDVQVSKFTGSLGVTLQNGDIALDDVRGPIEAKLVNGDIEVVYRDAEREGPHEFINVNGDVTLRLIEGMDADLKATIVNGSIDVDNQLGFQAQKRQPGWHVDTRLGDGGAPLTVKNVNGSIRFKK
ncbi:MAG TPA: DUF4097 family beta strand repeat-containing protein [Pyrinomonadaceae bacterium]